MDPLSFPCESRDHLVTTLSQEEWKGSFVPTILPLYLRSLSAIIIWSWRMILSFKEEKRDILSSKMHLSSFTSSNNFSLVGLSLENGWDQSSREKPSIRESNQNFARSRRLKLLKKCYFLRAFSLLSGMIDFNLYFWNKAIMCPVFTVLVNNYYFSWSILWKQQGTQEMHKN